mmetsp:Transcript_42294/g.48056  ORF Transcript_42294/g.48056 Transcript_42294/m.48056 type:complete len:206 (-) Transcript_42294:1687-2304(-)
MDDIRPPLPPVSSLVRTKISSSSSIGLMASIFFLISRLISERDFSFLILSGRSVSSSFRVATFRSCNSSINSRSCDTVDFKRPSFVFISSMRSWISSKKSKENSQNSSDKPNSNGDLMSGLLAFASLLPVTCIPDLSAKPSNANFNSFNASLKADNSFLWLSLVSSFLIRLSSIHLVRKNSILSMLSSIDSQLPFAKDTRRILPL